MVKVIDGETILIEDILAEVTESDGVCIETDDSMYNIVNEGYVILCDKSLFYQSSNHWDDFRIKYDDIVNVNKYKIPKQDNSFNKSDYVILVYGVGILLLGVSLLLHGLGCMVW